MDWFKFEEASFYGFVWLFAFLVAFARSCSSRRSQSVRVIASSSGLVGFYSFSVVSLTVGGTTGEPTSHWTYLGMSVVIGLLGPANEKMLIALAKRANIPVDGLDENGCQVKAEESIDDAREHP